MRAMSVTSASVGNRMQSANGSDWIAKIKNYFMENAMLMAASTAMVCGNVTAATQIMRQAEADRAANR